MNVVTYGGVETTQFLVSIYRPWFRDIFIDVIPLATITYVPTLYVLGREDPLGTSLLF
jgi:ABC-2 type transport system permease protein|tara:strand:+ start:1149 stop:1322 length:174 start_codon:yes stop_codon:yes gene_type:complete